MGVFLWLLLSFFIPLQPRDCEVALAKQNENKLSFACAYSQHCGSIAGRQITLPIEHIPNRDFLAYHKEKFLWADN